MTEEQRKETVYRCTHRTVYRTPSGNENNVDSGPQLRACSKNLHFSFLFYRSPKENVQWLVCLSVHKTILGKWQERNVSRVMWKVDVGYALQWIKHGESKKIRRGVESGNGRLVMPTFAWGSHLEGRLWTAETSSKDGETRPGLTFTETIFRLALNEQMVREKLISICWASIFEFTTQCCVNVLKGRNFCVTVKK